MKIKAGNLKELIDLLEGAAHIDVVTPEEQKLILLNKTLHLLNFRISESLVYKSFLKHDELSKRLEVLYKSALAAILSDRADKDKLYKDSLSQFEKQIIRIREEMQAMPKSLKEASDRHDAECPHCNEEDDEEETCKTSH